MSLATLVGFVVAYPINLWLVGIRLKHGMGTVRVLGHGGHDLAAERPSAPGTDGAMGEMVAGPKVTGPQIIGMSVLTLLALGTGVIIATIFGRWAM